jgi:hypothetical protein
VLSSTRSNDNIQFDVTQSLQISSTQQIWNILEKSDVFLPNPKDSRTVAAA